MTNIIAGINKFSLILAPAFYRLLYVSIIATVIGIVIIVARKFLDTKIPPKWISIFWLVFIIALVFPIKIESPCSIYNYVSLNVLILNKKLENLPDVSYRDIYDTSKYNEELYLKSETIDGNKAIEFKKETNKACILSLIFDILIPYLWFIAMIVLMMMYIISYIRFSKKVENIKTLDVRLLKLLKDCKKELNISRNIELRIQKYMKTPSIFGVFNIKILLDESINQMSDDQIKHVFMHELAHYKRKDNILNMIIVGIKGVYCLNPIIWMLCRQIRNDMELSTDEIVINNIENNQQKDYCKTLVNLGYMNNKQSMVKALCLSNDKNNLVRRITAIKLSEKFRANKITATILSVLIILTLSLIFCTDKMPDQVVENLAECRYAFNYTVSPQIIKRG